MITATEQNKGISHGLQIGKCQDDSIQDADHGYQCKNIGFIDDISILAETPQGMQTLLDVGMPEISAGGFVRIQDSSQVWEKREDEFRIITTGRSDYMPGPRTRRDSHYRGMEFSKTAGLLAIPRASANYNYSERDKTNKRVEGSWIQITNMGSITSTAADR